MTECMTTSEVIYEISKAVIKELTLLLRRTPETSPFIRSTEPATGALSPVYRDTDILALILCELSHSTNKGRCGKLGLVIG